LSLTLRAVAAIFVAAAVCGCGPDTTREVSATVLFVDGQPTFDRGAQKNPVPLTNALHPGRGDTLETPGTSRTGIALLPNLLALLDRGARMEIIRLAVTKDGNETGADMRGRFAEIRLGHGRLILSHAWGEALARFGVVTPQGEATTPSNALFVVESDPSKTRIICASGWVEFLPTGAAEATRIPPGSIGQWPSPVPNIAQAETDPTAQEDLAQAIETEQILRKLSAQKHNALPR
jgi:hypothetical protein